MNTESTPQDRRNVKQGQIGLSANQFGLSPDELEFWNENGYLVRLDVFTPEENDALRQVAEDIVDGKRPFPSAHIDQNALVRDGKTAQQGIYAMHKIHFPSCYDPEFLARVRDPRLTDPLVDLLGPDILGINTLFIWKAPKIGLGFPWHQQVLLFIWKAPKIGLGFPWHQDKFYFRTRFKTETTVGTWTAIDPADRENGCLFVIPGSHKWDIFQHDDLEGSQQREFKLARGVRDEDSIAVEVPPGAVEGSGFTVISYTRAWTIIACGSAVVLLPITSVRKQNGQRLNQRAVQLLCGFAVRLSPTKFMKSNAMSEPFRNPIDSISRGGHDDYLEIIYDGIGSPDWAAM